MVAHSNGASASHHQHHNVSVNSNGDIQPAEARWAVTGVKTASAIRLKLCYRK
jgi:hypothetical protein